MVLQMQALRDAYQAAALGKRISTWVSKDLKKVGLGHYPGKLPTRQEEWVILYVLQTPAGDLMEDAVNRLTEVNERVRELRSLEAKLEEVKKLICE